LSLALAGLLLAAAPAMAVMCARSSASSDPLGKPPHRVAGSPSIGAPAACAIAALFFVVAAATARRAELFQSELHLWQDAATKSHASVRPHLQYAALLKRDGRDREAWEAVSAAREIDPLNSQVALMSRVYRPVEVPQ
jgi:hypothetical protein